MRTTPDPTSDDSVVIRSVLEGDVNAFEILLRRYQGYVASIVSRHAPKDKIPELAHEVFVRAFQSLKTFRGGQSFRHWLAKITVRCCYDFWREYYRNREKPLSSISEENQQWIEDVLSHQSQEAFSADMRGNDAIDLLRWALDRLTPEERTILTLIHLEEYTAAEAAELLGWSVANVKIRAFRTRKKLRKIISKAIPKQSEAVR